MSIVRQIPADMYFSKVPTTVVFSDHLEDLDVSVWAYLDSSKRDYTGFDNSGIKWPVIKIDDLARDLGVSRRYAQYAINRLRDAGFLETEQTQDGNRFKLQNRSTEADTFRGREINEELFAVVTLDMLLYGPSARALRTWMILDRIKGANEFAFASQIGLSNYLGTSLKTAKRAVAELKEFGLLISERRTPGGMCKYELAIELVKHREAKPKKAVEKVAKPDGQDVPVLQTEEAKIATELTRTWLKKIVGDDWLTWVKANREPVRIVFNGIHRIVREDGPEFMRDLMASATATRYYGAGHHPEIIFDVLYEYYAEIGFDFEAAEADLEAVPGPATVTDLNAKPDTGDVVYLAPVIDLNMYRNRRNRTPVDLAV